MNATLKSHETVPIHQFPQAARHAVGAVEPDLQSVEAFPLMKRPARRILLADDDSGVREMLGRVLESESYRVTFAKTGREAATKFITDPPDLVLLDLNMPDRDGWAAFRVMNVTHPMLPIIVITARPNQYEKAADFGVDALMEKPLNLPVLLKAIHDLLRETEAERTRRIIDPNFTTTFLEHADNSSLEDAGQ